MKHARRCLTVIAQQFCEGRVYRVNTKGEITTANARGGWAQPSGQWRLLGAVRLNNFGYQVEYVPFERLDMLNAAWHHANGAQRWHIRDYDHGSIRHWHGPGYHGVFYADKQTMNTA